MGEPARDGGETWWSSWWEAGRTEAAHTRWGVGWREERTAPGVGARQGVAREKSVSGGERAAR
jgi:hypothetical protein